MTQVERTQEIQKMMEREGKTCSQERKGANDDSITKAEIKSPEEKYKSLQQALNPEEKTPPAQRTG